VSAVVAASITAGGALVGGYLQGEAAKDAASTSAAGSRYAADIGNKQYQQTREDLSPYRTAGEEALGKYAAYGQSQVNPGDYIQSAYNLNLDLYKDPSYQFRLNEMNRGIDRVSSGYGNLLSGNRLEDIMARSGEMASQEYGNMYNRATSDRAFQYGSDINRYNIAYGQETDYLNRLGGLVNTGLSAANMTAGYGANNATNAGTLAVNAANAAGAGQIGQANAYANTIGGITSAYGMYAGYNANQPPGSNTPMQYPNTNMYITPPWK